MNIRNLTYYENSNIRARVFKKSLAGSQKHRRRCWKIYMRLENMVTSGYYKETVYG